MDQHRPLTTGQLQALLVTASRHCARDRRARELPEGALVELRGARGAGKSTAALRFIAKAQRDGALAALVDADRTFDPDYAAALGVGADQLTLCRPGDGEAAIDIAATLVSSHAFSLVVLDSVTGLTLPPGRAGDDEMRVRLVARGLARVRNALTGSFTSVLCSHRLHTRADGQDIPAQHGRPLHYYADLHLHVDDVLFNGWSLPSTLPPH